MAKPTVGRIVRFFHAMNTTPYPAIVTGVVDENTENTRLHLTVFPSNNAPVTYAYVARANERNIAAPRWDWPERVEQSSDDLPSKLRAWVDQHKVRCEESIYQMDSVQEALPELAEIVCEAVGYYESDEDE